MDDISYNSTENNVFDEDDTIMYVAWKVQDLKEQGYSDKDVMEFMNNDDNLMGDGERVERFLRRYLCGYNKKMCDNGNI